jgi:hypothetical protein
MSLPSHPPKAVNAKVLTSSLQYIPATGFKKINLKGTKT